MELQLKLKACIKINLQICVEDNARSHKTWSVRDNFLGFPPHYHHILGIECCGFYRQCWLSLLLTAELVTRIWCFLEVMGGFSDCLCGLAPLMRVSGEYFRGPCVFFVLSYRWITCPSLSLLYRWGELRLHSWKLALRAAGEKYRYIGVLFPDVLAELDANVGWTWLLSKIITDSSIA